MLGGWTTWYQFVSRAHSVILTSPFTFFVVCRMHSVILSMESILFGLFVSAILCDQLQAIFSDETAVEQVSSSQAALPSAFECLVCYSATCGEGRLLRLAWSNFVHGTLFSRLLLDDPVDSISACDAINKWPPLPTIAMVARLALLAILLGSSFPQMLLLQLIVISSISNQEASRIANK